MLIKLAEFVRTNKPYEKVYQGKVVDNNDPLKLGRIKVTIDHYLEGDKEILPWITAKQQYSILGKVLIIPEIDDIVDIEFLDDDPYSMAYTFYNINKQNSLPIIEESIFGSDYPKTSGAIDSTGTYLVINKEKNTLKFHHSTGLDLEIDGQDNLKLKVTGKLEAEIEKTLKVYAKEKIQIISDTIIELNPDIILGAILDSARNTDETTHLCSVLGSPVKGLITGGNKKVKQNL